MTLFQKILLYGLSSLIILGGTFWAGNRYALKTRQDERKHTGEYQTACYPPKCEIEPIKLCNLKGEKIKIVEKLVIQEVKVPEIQWRDKIVEVPRIIYADRIVEIPRIEYRYQDRIVYQDRVVEVPRIEWREIIKEIPVEKIIIKEVSVDKIVEKIVYVDKIIEKDCDLLFKTPNIKVYNPRHD